MKELLQELIKKIDQMPLDVKIDLINQARGA